MFYIYEGGEFMKIQNKKKIKMEMKKLDEKLLKMVNENTIDEIIKIVEDFLRKLQ